MILNLFERLCDLNNAKMLCQDNVTLIRRSQYLSIIVETPQTATEAVMNNLIELLRQSSIYPMQLDVFVFRNALPVMN